MTLNAPSFEGTSIELYVELYIELYIELSSELYIELYIEEPYHPVLKFSFKILYSKPLINGEALLVVTKLRKVR